MSLQTIDHPVRSPEAFRKVSDRVRTALADRAIKKRTAVVSERVKQLHELPFTIEVAHPRTRDVSRAISAVRDIAELTTNEIPSVKSEAVEALDDSAEHLFKDLKEFKIEDTPQGSLGIRAVYDALEAWDTARTDATHDLAAVALNSFKGVAQPNLVAAFNSAKISGKSFDEELDRINGVDVKAS